MLAPGTKLSRYEIRSKLAEGGMGEVYLAWDSELNRTVAVKVLHGAVAANEQRVRRLIQEAQAASTLHDPHILRIHEIGSTGNRRFIATEFIDGDTLRSRINNGSQNLNEILELPFKQRAHCRPLTRPESFTAISSPRTSWSAAMAI